MGRRFAGILVGILFCSFAAPAFAAWQKPEFKVTQEYRYDMRHEGHELYISRFACGFNYGEKDGRRISIIPFFELRRNVDRSFTERKELGIEAGVHLTPWFYVAESFQATWLKEDYGVNYSHTKKRDAAEAETRLVAMHKLCSIKNIDIKGFILDEFTYDFDIGASTRNEFAFGVLVPLHKNIETKLNWRHIDRIHDFDSDVMEAAVTVVF